MALSAAKLRSIHSALGVVPDRRMGLTLSAVVYQGAYLSRPADGYVNPAAVTQAFSGIAMETKTGGAADGDVEVMVSREGLVLDNVTGASAKSSEDALVYATDDDTLTTTAATNVPVGRIEEWLSGTQCWVHYYAGSLEQNYA